MWKLNLYLPNSCPVPGVLRNRPGCYEPLNFDACIIEILSRRLCCDNPNIFANFDAENTDTSASWTFLSWWKEGLASDRVCLNVELCFTEALKRSDRWRCACRSTQEQRQLGQARFAVCQFSVLLQKALLKARFENLCTHPIAFQRGVSLWTLASWDGTPTVAKFFRTCQENQKSFISKPPKISCLSRVSIKWLESLRGQALKFCPAKRLACSIFTNVNWRRICNQGLCSALRSSHLVDSAMLSSSIWSRRLCCRLQSFLHPTLY